MNKTALLLSLSLLLQACASVKTHNKKFLEVNSYPDEAEVWLGDELVCTTPCKYDVSGARNEIFKVTVRKDGYSSYEQELRPKTNKDAEADIIMCILPPIGVAMLGIDYYTGSLWTYDKVTARLYENKYEQDTEVHVRNSMSLSPAAKRFITDNFEKLKEEAFSGRMQILSERIRTLSSLTSLTPERLTGMISEAPDAAALISYIEKYGK